MSTPARSGWTAVVWRLCSQLHRRHTCAVHLVASGVDSTVIQGWLGHASPETTNHYAQADIETKRRALELLPRVPKARGAPRWRRDESLLAWLEAL
jgi:integrase